MRREGEGMVGDGNSRLRVIGVLGKFLWSRKVSDVSRVCFGPHF